ncbi:Transmembrane protein [Quillaja saponaria]|uniref:Transmembrane protein n=1 Tax=Quillaja saponaria TaxID=32244 RepID=A0AAD7VIH2_QUISA|nr:Transmembrane protein [Quillaja saponaria]
MQDWSIFIALQLSSVIWHPTAWGVENNGGSCILYSLGKLTFILKAIIPRLHNLRSTAQLFREATSSFSSNPFTFLFLSLLIFSFRTVVENGTLHVTSFIDRDPSLKALLSRLDLAGNGNRHHLRSTDDPSQAAVRRHRRRPFLHLTRVGTLDDDFFSGDDDDNRSLFGSNRKVPVNGSSIVLGEFNLKSGFSDLVVDNGIRVSQVVRSGITFKAEGVTFSDDKDSEDYQEEESKTVGLDNDQEVDRVVDLQFFVKGLEFGRRDAAALFFLVSFLSAAYGWVILVFLVTYSWVLGIVFITVVNDLLGRFSSFFGVIWDGSRLGLKRLSGFILMRWAVRDALTQLLGLWYFGEIEDQYSFFKLFVRLKLMPFSILSPWIRGFEKEISGFLFAWFLIDTFVAFIFSIDAWVAIVDSRRSGREIVKEGCYLISTMFNQAVQIKCLEAIFCGSFVRWVLARICGNFLAKVFQSTVEIYFMVAWLIFYFSARCKDANLQGRRFGQRELEGLIEGQR